MPESKIELERIYTVPLSRAWITARHKRTRRAVKILREFAEKHMKSEEIKIDTELNERLWNRGITRPPRRIKVKMEKDEDGVVTISLPQEKVEAETPAPKEELPVTSEEVKKETEPAKEEPPKKEAAAEKTPKKETKKPPKKRQAKAKSKKE